MQGFKTENKCERLHGIDGSGKTGFTDESWIVNKHVADEL
jgi:hypothetical protein